jgi:hypothetical protein
MQRLHPPTLPLSGGCPCEAVRFAVTALPLLVFACHCTECQRWSGSAFGLSMPVRRASFALTHGTPKRWRHTGASGFESSYWFCAACGGRILGERADQPENRHDTRRDARQYLLGATDRPHQSGKCASLAKDSEQRCVLRGHAEGVRLAGEAMAKLLEGSGDDLEHDPEKCAAVFRKDRAQSRI